MTKRTTTAKPPRRVKAVILPLHDKVTALPVTAIPFISADEPWESVKLPMWQIPRTAAAYDAMVEQMAKAYEAAPGCHRDGIRAALSSIGICLPNAK